MKATNAPISVADFCQGIIGEKIVVNRDYQRDDRIWSSYVRSYFIESILLEYPIPKIYLYVKYDLKTKTSVKEIVDGQQRSQALRAFYENKLRLSRRLETEELQGKRYKDLSDELQGTFLSYSLSVDEFSGVGEEEIRESFARMNANNISLNAEELRNARYQGEFKQFVLRLCRAYREVFLEHGLISKRDVIRMSDTKMVADIISILEDGFHTTRPVDVDSLYSRYDTEYPGADVHFVLVQEAINYWDQYELWAYEELNSKHTFYTLIAAIIEKLHPGTVTSDIHGADREILDDALATKCSLDALNDAISKAKAKEEEEDGNGEPLYPEFAASSMVKTNVGREKLIRFAFLLSALRDE